MRHLLLLALAALSAASFATAGRHAAPGAYRLVPDDATRAFCRRHGISLPTGKLLLRENGTFSLTVSDDEGIRRTLGKYAQNDDSVEFHVEDGDGLDLPREMVLEEGGLYSRGASFERVEAERPASPRQPRVRNANPEPSREILPLLSTGAFTPGIWTLRRNGREDRATRFTFYQDGTFRFSGANAESRGRYVKEERSIELSWTEIDGEPVRNQSVRKRIPLDASGFNVDDYRYERQR